MSYAIDRPEIILMENQLQIDLVDRTASYFHENINELTDSVYCHAVYEEYYRKYETVSIAPNAPPTLECCDYHNMNASLLRFPDVEESNTIEETPPPSAIAPPEHTRVLHNYHPIGLSQPSVYRKVPTGNQYLVDNCTLGYTKLLVSIAPKLKLTSKNKILEPIFGTVSLYCLNKRGDGGDLVKIAETFNFDSTPNDIRHNFQHIYRANTSNDKSLTESNLPLHFNPIGNISKCLFSFPSELLLSQDLFLVIELSKVLTGDPDKSLLPYVNPDKKNIFGGNNMETNSLQETCTRLRKFRQPLGISVMKVFNDGQIFQNHTTPGASFLPVSALKYCLSDAGLKQVTLLPPPHTPSHTHSPYLCLSPPLSVSLSLSLSVPLSVSLSAHPRYVP
jgi:hypothetical protein